MDEEIEIKEEDLGYGQSKSGLLDSLNVAQASQIKIIKFEPDIDISVQIMIHSENQLSSQGLPCAQKGKPHLPTRPALKIHKCVNKNCSAVFESKLKLIGHVDQAHTEEKGNAKNLCSICKESFPTKRSLAIHVNKSHTAEKYKKSGKSDEFDPDYNIESGRECDPDNGPPLSMIQEVRRPCRQSQGPAKNLNSKSSKSEMGLLPSLWRFKCKECGISFARMITLVAHTRIHTGEKPFKCDVCDKSFSRKWVFISHQRMHTGEKPFKCDVCDQTFSQKRYLISHQRNHTGETPYECGHCEKGFKDRSTLVHHQKVHTGEKPYSCDVCGKAFSWKRDCASHKANDTGVKPYACPVCGKCFRTSGQMTRHKKIHTGEKPYKCKKCEMSFRNSNDLTKHERIHSRPAHNKKTH